MLLGDKHLIADEQNYLCLEDLPPLIFVLSLQTTKHWVFVNVHFWDRGTEVDLPQQAKLLNTNTPMLYGFETNGKNEIK